MSNYDTVLDRATEVLGDKEKAIDWMDKKSRTLKNAPSVVCETKAGLKKVLLHLNNIERLSFD